MWKKTNQPILFEGCVDYFLVSNGKNKGFFVRQYQAINYHYFYAILTKKIIILFLRFSQYE